MHTCTVYAGYRAFIFFIMRVLLLRENDGKALNSYFYISAIITCKTVFILTDELDKNNINGRHKSHIKNLLSLESVRLFNEFMNSGKFKMYF